MTEPSLFWTLFQTGLCALIGIFCLCGGLAYIRDYLQGSSDTANFWGGCLHCVRVFMYNCRLRYCLYGRRQEQCSCTC